MTIENSRNQLTKKRKRRFSRSEIELLLQVHDFKLYHVAKRLAVVTSGSVLIRKGMHPPLVARFTSEDYKLKIVADAKGDPVFVAGSEKNFYAALAHITWALLNAPFDQPPANRANVFVDGGCA